MHNYDLQFHVQGFKLCSVCSDCSYNQQGSPGTKNQLAIIHNLQWFLLLCNNHSSLNSTAQEHSEKRETSIQPFQNCCDPEAGQDQKKWQKQINQQLIAIKCKPERHGNSLGQKTCIKSFPHGWPHEHLIFFLSTSLSIAGNSGYRT